MFTYAYSPVVIQTDFDSSHAKSVEVYNLGLFATKVEALAAVIAQLKDNFEVLEWNLEEVTWPAAESQSEESLHEWLQETFEQDSGVINTFDLNQVRVDPSVLDALDMKLEKVAKKRKI
jgi:hypothetical protein